uniref:Uncharacterized protein n=1 Tax=Lepeophtheirus salmonis TaxID=72036 RepID=A0A0K2U4Q7_LEPSM
MNRASLQIYRRLKKSNRNIRMSLIIKVSLKLIQLTA